MSPADGKQFHLVSAGLNRIWSISVTKWISLMLAWLYNSTKQWRVPMAIVIRESTKFGKFWHFATSSSTCWAKEALKNRLCRLGRRSMSKTEVTKKLQTTRQLYVFMPTICPDAPLRWSLWILVCDVIAPTSFQPNFMSIGSSVSDFRHHNFLILRSLSCRPYNNV